MFEIKLDPIINIEFTEEIKISTENIKLDR